MRNAVVRGTGVVLLAMLAANALALERMTGVGRALIVDGDRPRASGEALARALEEVGLRAGATIETRSALDANGALDELTLMRSSHRVVTYEKLDEQVADGAVTVTIGAWLEEEEPHACDGGSLGGTIEVKVQSGYQDLPGQAQHLRRVDALRRNLVGKVLAGLNEYRWAAPVRFVAHGGERYERLTRPAEPNVVLRGVLELAVTMRPATNPETDANVSVAGRFHDALSGGEAVYAPAAAGLPAEAAVGAVPAARRWLKSLQPGQARAASAPPRPVGIEGALMQLAQRLDSTLCAPLEVPLRAFDKRLEVAIGAQHGVGPGFLFRVDGVRGGGTYLRIERLEAERSLLAPLDGTVELTGARSARVIASGG